MWTRLSWPAPSWASHNSLTVVNPTVSLPQQYVGVHQYGPPPSALAHPHPLDSSTMHYAVAGDVIDMVQGQGWKFLLVCKAGAGGTHWRSAIYIQGT